MDNSKINSPKISVIIPTYNEEENIEITLRKIKKQNCDFLYDIIVVDGQSSDNTVSIAKKYAKVLDSPQKGKAFQSNYAARKTTSDLLVFLDADTWIEPNFLSEIYRIFNRKKKLIACSARVKYDNGKSFSFKVGSRRYTITSYFFLNFNMHVFYLFRNLFRYPELIGCNIIVRRDIFFKVGGFKQPPSNLLGIDKVFSDALIYLRRKMKRGKIRNLNFISVLTSGRFLSARRSLGRIVKYHTEKELYYDLAKDNKFVD